MSGARKVAANRANARASTGPKSVAGKKRAAQNARRHGLSIPVAVDPVVSAEIKSLAHAIAGDGISADLYNLAVRIADAQMDVVRVRRARHQLLDRELSNDPYLSSRTLFGGRSRRDKRNGTFSCLPEGPEKFATILVDYAAKLAALDRYERRALSRRKFAIRDFDISRQQRAAAGKRDPTTKPQPATLA